MRRWRPFGRWGRSTDGTLSGGEGREGAQAQDLPSGTGYDLADNRALEALRWRAREPGPDQAQRDFLRGGGWARRDRDRDGVLLPPEPGEEPSDRMWRQHVR